MKKGEKYGRYNVNHKDKMMGVRFTEEGWKEVDYLCESLGLSKAGVIRRAVTLLADKVRTAKKILKEDDSGVSEYSYKRE